MSIDIMLSPDAHRERLTKIIVIQTRLPNVLVSIIQQYTGRPISNIDTRTGVAEKRIIKTAFKEDAIKSIAANHWTMNRSISIRSLRHVILDDVILRGALQFGRVEQIDLTNCIILGCAINVDVVSTITMTRCDVENTKLNANKVAVVDNMTLKYCVFRGTTFAPTLKFKNLSVMLSTFHDSNINSSFDSCVFADCGFVHCKIGIQHTGKAAWNHVTMTSCWFDKTILQLIIFTSVKMIDCNANRTLFCECVLLQTTVEGMITERTSFLEMTFVHSKLDFTSTNRSEYSDFINCIVSNMLLDNCGIIKCMLLKCKTANCIIADGKTDVMDTNSHYGKISDNLIVFPNEAKIAPYIRIACRALSIKRMVRHRRDLANRSIIVISNDTAYFDAESLRKYADMIPGMASTFYRAAVHALGESKHKHIFPRFNRDDVLLRVNIKHKNKIVQRTKCDISGQQFIHVSSNIVALLTNAEKRIVAQNTILHRDLPFISINKIAQLKDNMRNMHLIATTNQTSKEKYVYIEQLK